MKPRVKRHSVVQPPDQSIKFIPLTRGQTAIVDAADYEWLSQFNWYALKIPSAKYFYAARDVIKAKSKKCILMHTAITGFARTDHKNRNTMDNRRENLRACTRAQNSANSIMSKRNKSGFRGVNWHKQRQKWCAEIRPSRKKIHLGLFTEIEDAARAYDAAARKYFGEFAHTNFK